MLTSALVILSNLLLLIVVSIGHIIRASTHSACVESSLVSAFLALLSRSLFSSPPSSSFSFVAVVAFAAVAAAADDDDDDDDDDDNDDHDDHDDDALIK